MTAETLPAQGCEICDELAAADTPFVLVDDATAVFAAALQPARNHGCVLLVTVAHVETLYDLSDEMCAVVMRRLRDVARAVQVAAGADGTTIRQNNHPPGQEVAHLHFHVAPRFHGDAYWASSAAPVDHGLRVEQAQRIAEVLETR